VTRMDIPLSEYENVTEATDEDIDELNSMIGEDSFRQLSNDLFEEIKNPTINEEDNTGVSGKAEATSSGTAKQNQEKNISNEKKSGVATAEKPISERGKELADRIRALK